MQYLLSGHDKIIRAVVQLPSSKSISNRVLIMNAISFSPYGIGNLSDSDDTRVMKQVIDSNSSKFNIGHAGTAMRFLTAFLSRIVGEWMLTGSERMKQRPIGILVDALRELGADIRYAGKVGYPPIVIRGSHLKGKLLELDGSVSSQYISALLMIGPTLEGGLTLKLKNRITSRSYIELTLALMKEFGIHSEWKDDQIRIEEQTYLPPRYTVESDWSGASYWYQLLALADEGEVELLNLHLPSVQGDCVLADWFRPFGVASRYTGNSVVISRTTADLPEKLELDFIENPDIAQTMAVLCVLKRLPFHFRGLGTLKIKETDRIAALQNELAKFGAELVEPAPGELGWDGKFPLKKAAIPVISTYHDHRMALAFAPVALCEPVIIDDPRVITKSYPGYYNDLRKAGIEVTETQEPGP